jgi:CubicO group peptidase (beta-lactamase class C family)
VGALDQVAGWPVGTAAAAVVGPAGVLAAHGPQGASFAWASVTKLLTALTVLEGYDDGLIDLDEAGGPPGATVRHLLAHAGGVAPEGDQPAAPPGRRRIYSNRGYELLAEVVTARTGEAFPQRLAGRILRPLGLASTRLAGSPAHGALGSLADLAALGRELLGPRVLDPGIVGLARTVAYPGLDGVLPGFGRQQPNDWGLGPELRGGKRPHWTGTANSPETFGHFGRAGGFLWVDPVADLALAVLTDRDFGPWAAAAWPPLADDVLAAYGRPGATARQPAAEG